MMLSQVKTRELCVRRIRFFAVVAGVSSLFHSLRFSLNNFLRQGDPNLCAYTFPMAKLMELGWCGGDGDGPIRAIMVAACELISSQLHRFYGAPGINQFDENVYDGALAIGLESAVM
jgi:hypothetical protein